MIIRFSAVKWQRRTFYYSVVVDCLISAPRQNYWVPPPVRGRPWLPISGEMREDDKTYQLTFITPLSTHESQSPGEKVKHILTFVSTSTLPLNHHQPPLEHINRTSPILPGWFYFAQKCPSIVVVGKINGSE